MEDYKVQNSHDKQRNAENKVRKWNTLHIVLSIASLSPILFAWPFAFFVAAAFGMSDGFDPDENRVLLQVFYWIIFLSPVYLIANAVISRKMFKKGKLNFSFILVLSPPVLGLIFLLSIFGQILH